ncbi:ABC transporter permease [Aureimonas populi]|uniref:ABC transporter permease n=1 Tax=Aureimonas populi TaxID=1701758 RepID=A0ABW5CLZ9_9HYPH|nr:ABC transporter permease [Aureimonas populi]
MLNSRRRSFLLRRAGVGIHHVLAWLVFLFLLAPLLIVVPISFSGGAYLRFPPESYSTQWYEAYFAQDSWINATILSLQIGIVATIISVSVGFLFALGITRGLRSWAPTLEKLAIAPMVVPSIVYSVSMYSLFSSLGLVGNWFGIALAHAILCLPFVVIVLAASLREYDMDQEIAALGLGASRLTAIRRITIPQIRPSLLSAAFLAFITSFDELVVAMFLSGTFGTLPKKMFDNIRLQIDPTIAAVSVMEIVMVILVMAVLLRINRANASRLT